MTHPNIIYILADDMGYGDVRHLDPACAFPTPNIDRLGQEGLTCTDAHSSSAVCTPSRYSLLTGRYCWRTMLNRGVLNGSSPHLIEPGRLTLASLLKQAGYRTACIGKWHVGWDWAVRPGHTATDAWRGADQAWIDYSKPIGNGPTTVGFDHFYGISGSLDMPPYVYVENDLPVGEPTAWGTASEFFREGPRLPELRTNNVLGHLTDKACTWIEQASAASEPFFCYFPLTAPHTPISPAPEFDGISGINPYADFCMEVDARVGQVLDTLERLGIAEDTLVVFTSDNGASAKPCEADALREHYGHRVSAEFRGFKSDIWEGGHRLPHLIRWPAGIDARAVCSETIGLFDFVATVAELTGQDLAVGQAEDSLSFLPAFLGQPLDPNRRGGLVHHSIEGRFAIRQGPWKLCRCPGSGGWTLRDEAAEEQGLPPLQLYHMDDDVGEQRNRLAEQPELAVELTQALHRIVAGGGSIPERASANARSIDDPEWWQVDWRQEIPERFLVDD
jgi:arylsulfatase A-like enzyme